MADIKQSLGEELGDDEQLSSVGQVVNMSPAEPEPAWDIDAKVNWIEIRLRQVEERIGDLEQVENRLTELIEQLNMAGQSTSKKNVYQAQFEDMVEDCISKGHSLGCSQSFIRQFLAKNHGQEDNRYVRRRLSHVLKKKVANGDYKLENNLYSLA